MASELREYMEEAGNSVCRKQQLPESVLSYRPPVDVEELLDGMTLDRLHEIFRSVLRRQEDKIDPIRSRFGHIEKEEVSLPDKMTFVERFAVKERKFSFRRLLEGLGFGGVVVTEVYRDSFSQVKELANSLSYTKKAFETPIS